MENTSALFYFYIALLNFALTLGDTQLQPRTFSCSEKSSDGHKVLTCEKHTRIPLPEDANDSDHDGRPVTGLDMSNKNNHLQILKTEEFKNADLLNLNSIKLQKCQIRTVEQGAFRDLDALTEIDLRNNNIDSWNLETLEINNNLQYLYLSGNRIHQFIGTQFSQLPKLSKLDFSNCNINKIPVNIFKKLDKLKEIDFRNNKISRLDWNMFENVNTVTHIFLDGNKWYCDCHLRFLLAFFAERNTNISPNMICTEPEKYANVTIKNISQEALTCHPQITEITASGGSAVITQGDSDSDHSDLIVYSETGKNIGLQCSVDGFPEPHIIWMKDGQTISETHPRGLISNDENGTEHHVKVLKAASNLTRTEFQYQFSKLLTIYNTSKTDMAAYECVAQNAAGRANKILHLNFTNIVIDEIDAITTVTSAGGQTWLWILIAVLIVLFISLLTVCILIWRRRDKQRQLKYKEEMLNKFKGSEIVLDDSFAAPRKHEPTATVPLLSSANKGVEMASPRRTSVLPDVAQDGIGHGAEQAPSLSPVVFSPRPQSADLRRHFFAVPEQKLERPSRPGSAMSLANYYGPPSAREFPGRPQLYSNRIHNYRMAQFAVRRPWGSSQSLVHPESTYYGGHRPQLTRQLSGPAVPAYATMRLPSREGRPPSISSMNSEPWHMHRSGPVPGYVTLPRNYTHATFPRADSGCGPSVSPTESSYSTFSYTSTMPRMNPSHVIYDSVGPRTTADGGSNLSLNKIGGDPKIDVLDSISYGLASPTKGKIRPGGRTPNSLRGRNDFFNFDQFEPIAEVEGSEQDLGARATSNSEVDQVLPKLQIYPQPSESKYKKKKPPPIFAIPPRSRKPIRTFEYSKLGTSKEYDFDASLDGDKIEEESEKTPDLPTTPIPSSDALKSSIENIIEVIEGTEV